MGDVGDRTGRLGRQDSNLRISMKGSPFEASKEFPAISMNQGIRDFRLRVSAVDTVITVNGIF